MSGSGRRRIAFFGDSLTEGRPGVSFFSLLEEMFPDDVLINAGKGGDTARSLLRRIKNSPLPALDVSFIWIGVNDILARADFLYGFLKRIRGQPATGSLEGFRKKISMIFDLLEVRSGRVVAVPPLCLGEDFTNSWNRRLEPLKTIMRQETASRPKTEFLDLRREFISHFKNDKAPPFQPKSTRRLIVDRFFSLFYTSRKQCRADGVLLFTVDGIHLNSLGARLAADVFEKTIRRIAAESNLPSEDRL